jgi:hypothetical protein
MNCGRGTRGRRVSRANWRRSRLVWCGRPSGWASDGGGRRQRPRGGLRRADRLDRGRWQRRHQHHAADATGIDADAASLIVRRRRGLTGGIAVTGDRAGAGRRIGRGAGSGEAREQPAKRNHIGGRERNDAPPQRSPGEGAPHAKPFSGLPIRQHHNTKQIPWPDDCGRCSLSCVGAATDGAASRTCATR